MVVVASDKKRVSEVDKSVFEELKGFLLERGRSFSYIDDMGDVILVEDGKEYIVPSSEDMATLSRSEERDEYLSESELLIKAIDAGSRGDIYK